MLRNLWIVCYFLKALVFGQCMDRELIIVKFGVSIEGDDSSYVKFEGASSNYQSSDWNII
jgi:hypothetical protein